MAMVTTAQQQQLLLPSFCCSSTSGAFFFRSTAASSSSRCLLRNNNNNNNNNNSQVFLGIKCANKNKRQRRLCDAASASSSQHSATLDMRSSCFRIVCEADGDEEEEEAGKAQGDSSSSRLGSIIRNKQRILESNLRSMPAGELETRLSATRAASPPNKLLDAVAQQILQGRTAILVEAARLSPAESPESLARRCADYVAWGATALSICTDEEKSPNGVADLTAVCTAVTVPVLRKDWILHPLQIAETCEAGASAVTAVYSVLSKGTWAILNFAVSLGLDAIVEVVNMKELQELAPLGLPIYGFNLSVGLALSLPGIRQDISKSLIGEIPFGASSVVGVYSIEEARAMKAAGADAVYIKHEVLQGQQATEKEPKVFLENLRVAMSGDD